MKLYEIELNGKQYAMLEKMLFHDDAQRLAMNQSINGYDMIRAMLHVIYSPVSDGWSTHEVMLDESKEELDFLRYITKHIVPEDEDFFVRQLGKPLVCDKNFEIIIKLKL